jgi:hypothetical protein
VTITLQSDYPASDSLWPSKISAESENKWKSYLTFSTMICVITEMKRDTILIWKGNFDESPSDEWYHANFTRTSARC